MPPQSKIPSKRESGVYETIPNNSHQVNEYSEVELRNLKPCSEDTLPIDEEYVDMAQ